MASASLQGQQRMPSAATKSKSMDLSSKGLHENNADPDSYLQPLRSRPFRRRKNILTFKLQNAALFLSFMFLSFISLSNAAFINFANCLSSSIVDSSNPKQLQWVPLWVNVRFDQESPSYHVNITIYGNVTGQATTQSLPPIDSPIWRNGESTNGKIVNVSITNPTETLTTLKQQYDVLTYTPYNSSGFQFCHNTVNVSCPIAPAFYKNPHDPYDLPAFAVGHAFNSSYGFTTITATIYVISGDQGFPDIACVSANITPYLGGTVEALLAYLPLVVLAIVGIATAFVAMFSPWGSMNPFRWTSNYGRDEDLLRLVTPGFGDCLQYIQFIVLSGSLSLNYPGYYQPVVSQVAWSSLMFNESFVSGGNGSRSLIDGLYATNGTYGLTRMTQLVGMTRPDDAWAGMIIWLLIIIAAVTVLCQIGFFFRWVFRMFNKQHKEDLRRQNWPFTAGNVVRLVGNFFLLPLVALSMFQLVIASHSPSYVTALAVILIVIILVFGGWMLYLLIRTKPRQHLFDDLPTVLLYGPLYNTYSDDSAPFALVPFLITFIRGVAIGGVQPSGIAQLVILAICEVIYILTLYAFKPYQAPTSMNVYHTFFATIRLAVTLLSIAFAPPLGVTEAPKGWIGYVILLLHAVVLAFGFLLNAILKIVEIALRLAGAGGDEVTGAATRGGLRRVFGVRDLSRRAKRPGLRQSVSSNAVLADDRDAEPDAKSAYGGRSRSLSASSAILLNQRGTPTSRMSGHFDQYSQGDPMELTNQVSNHSFSYIPGATAGAAIAAKGQKRPDVGPIDPYYRAPRQRRHTGEMMTPGARSRNSGNSADLVRKNTDDSPEQIEQRDSPLPQRPFSPQQQLGRASPGFLRERGDSDPNLNDPRRNTVDYAVREVDFYYGVRGPALSSNQPTRKLKTGPADPVGPVSSATGWFKGMFGRKKKDSVKGFEVVRSIRAPPEQLMDDIVPEQQEQEPYHDSPQSPEAYIPGQRTRSNEEDREQAFEKTRGDFDDDDDSTPVNSEDETGTNKMSAKGSMSKASMSKASYAERGLSDFAPTLEPIETVGGLEFSQTQSKESITQRSYTEPEQVSEFAPALGPIETVGGIELPSRFGSERTSRNVSRNASTAGEGASTTTTTRRGNAGAADDRAAARVSTVLEGPERNTPSPRNLPFTSVVSYHLHRQSAGGESASTTAGRASHSMGDRSEGPPLTVEERPTSVGYVAQHRASDHLVEPGGGAAGEGARREPSEAEVVNSTPRRTPRTSRGSRGSGGGGSGGGAVAGAFE